MKMAKNKQRLFAALLAILMVVSIIPAAAIGVNAATSDLGTVVSGQSVSYTYNAGYSSSVTSYVPVYDSTLGTSVNKYYGMLSINNIDSVIACDYDLGVTPAGVINSSDVSAYATTAASYDATVLRATMNTALDAKGAHFEVPSFSASYKDQLTKVSFSYSGSTAYKTVYLYAKITPYTYTFNTGYSYASATAGTTYYQQIGTVTLYSSYRSSFDLTLSETSGTIACGQSVALIANVAGATNVAYVAYVENASGIASITEQTEGVFIITANELVTSGNKITIFAYQMDGSGNYLYRSTGGLETTSTTFDASGITVNNVKYYPIYDTASAYYSTKSPITSIILSQASLKCEVGDTVQVNATTLPIGASGSVSYTSSNSAVATVNSYGVVTAKGVGTTYIYVTANDGSGVSAYCTVTVTAMTAKLSLDKSATSVEIGKTVTLTATIVPTVSNPTVYWSSSNSAVATVAGGVVKGVKAGTAVITASYYTSTGVIKTASCTVTVKEKSAVITAPATLTVKVGETAQIDATIANATDNTLLYVSDDNNIVKVDTDGVVTGVKAGSAMITIVSAEDAEIKAYCVVTVKDEKYGIIEKDATYKKGSKYYWTKSISSADVKAAIAEVKGEDKINVWVKVDSKSASNKTIFTRYAISRLSKYADSLTIEAEGKTFTFDSADLKKMANGRPVYIYTKGSKVSVQYKNEAGKYVKFTGLTVVKG